MNTRWTCAFALATVWMVGCARAGAPEAQTAGAPIDSVASTKLVGERGYAYALRRDDAIAVTAEMPDRTPIGGVTLSHAPERSEPVIVARKDGALVGWAERDHAGDPWRVRLVRWVPGLAPETLDVQVAASTTNAPPSMKFGRDRSGEHTLLVDAPRLVAGR